MKKRLLLSFICMVAASMGGAALASDLGTSSLGASSFGDRLAQSAMERTKLAVKYDPSYFAMDYPGGDAPADRGVCSDVVIRSLRMLGVDLQQDVHEDMRIGFAHYPKIWGLSKPDHNIDHRRVPNLQVYFKRKGLAVPITRLAQDYKPGDIVSWNLRGDAGYLPHIGIVAEQTGPSGWPMIVHNIGSGPQLADVLFSWPITGHYRYTDS